MARKKREKVEKAEMKNKIKPEYVALGLLAVVILAGAFVFFSQSGGTLDAATAAEKLISWLKDYFRASGLSADIQLKGVKDLGSVYEVNLLITAGGQSQMVTYYISKDGQYFFPIGIKLEPIEVESPVQPQQNLPPKSDRPTVELFVMSYCPYGMQMEKALIPVLRLLGDKVDFQLRFVNYIMHGEKEVWENIRQYCIQREYGTEKLLDYLECFVITNPDNPDACMEELNIDKNVIEACIQEINQEYNIAGILADPSTWIAGRYPPFPLDDQKNVEYGVRGSPTLVINGTVVSVTRSPEAIKQLICAAFTNPPPECETPLDSTPTSPGFGEGTGTATAAQCG
ncbi:MAG: hypothetical protein GXO00_01090 [Candidatus Diapherotrites archaeon]|nr:hypothetical protein [Candidatus Diapherotrites archaeon]